MKGYSGSLPPLQSNQEIDITMELRRMKKPGISPQLGTVLNYILNNNNNFENFTKKRKKNFET